MTGQNEFGNVIGIDLGTTYSRVAVQLHGRVEIIANDQGQRMSPSYVAFTDKERLVGDAAKNQYASNPERTVFNAKRLIGRRYNNDDVKMDMKHFPFKLVNKNGAPNVQVAVNNDNMVFAPEQISGMALRKMKETAEAYLGDRVTHAVVSVPACFTDAQRQATKVAGTIAGLTILRFINEPTAAAIAYGLDGNHTDDRVLVYDLGGGTFDVSLLSIEGGIFEVLATAGDTHLGGEDFDNRVVDYFVNVWKEKNGGEDITSDLKTMAKLKQEVEKTKRELSSEMSVDIKIESFFQGKDLSETLTRAKFEELNDDLFRKTLKSVEQVLKDGSSTKDDVYDIVVVGGSTRIPKVQELLEDFFNGKKPAKGINPDEAVAYGAAVQGAVLSDERESNLMVIDVNPLTIGAETTGGVMSKVISRNTALPTKSLNVFSTDADNQSTVLIQVYEGEHAKNKLGTFTIDGIAPARRGVPQIEVTFDIDASGILNVSAAVSGKSESITITNDKVQLSQEDIDRMVREAEELAEKDRVVRERAEYKNRLEDRINTVKNELADKDNSWTIELSDADKKTIADAIKDKLNWLEKTPGASRDDFSDKLEEFESMVNPIIGKVSVDEDF
ncbi:unnamed protein product [Absidia cylindrospora]